MGAGEPNKVMGPCGELPRKKKKKKSMLEVKYAEKSRTEPDQRPGSVGSLVPMRVDIQLSSAFSQRSIALNK